MDAVPRLTAPREGARELLPVDGRVGEQGRALGMQDRVDAREDRPLVFVVFVLFLEIFSGLVKKGKRDRRSEIDGEAAERRPSAEDPPIRDNQADVRPRRRRTKWP